MARPFLITACVFLFCVHTSTSPLCVSAPLPVFIAETSIGCMIGPALITNLYTTDLADGSVVKPIPAANISVTPGDSGLSFAVNAYAAGSYKELIIAFQVSAPALYAASISVYGSPIESGTAQVVEHICEGAPFKAPAFHRDVAWDGCDQNGGTPVTFSAALRTLHRNRLQPSRRRASL